MPDTRSEYTIWRDELATPTTPLPIFPWAKWAFVLALVACAVTFLILKGP